jgi:HPt (histidine-containing phosphotransfer) domain-containing protein
MSVTNEMQQDPDFQALVQVFLQKLPEMVNDICGSYAKQDWDTMQRVSHKLKGMGGGFGFPELTDIAQKINADVKAGEYEKLDSEVKELQAMFDDIMHKHANSKSA